MIVRLLAEELVQWKRASENHKHGKHQKNKARKSERERDREKGCQAAS